MVMMSDTSLPVGPPWGVVCLLPDGLVPVYTGRERGGVRWGSSCGGCETREGGAEKGFVRSQEVVWWRGAVSPQL